MKAGRAQGFTLIELLIAMVLVALSAGLVVLSIPESGSRQARQEAQQLQNLLRLLRQEAVLNFEDYGLRIDPDRYRVMQLNTDGQWEAAPGFQSHTLPRALRLHLESSQSPTTNAPHSGSLPQIQVFSSDQTNAYTLRIEHNGKALLSLSSDGIQDAQLQYRN